jgi:hypothetical protein
MWHGEPGSGRRHVRIGRFGGRRVRSDTDAVRFIERLEAAVRRLEPGGGDFARAARKADHVEELRRVLGLLLDVLAEWEMIAAHSGQRPVTDPSDSSRLST